MPRKQKKKLKVDSSEVTEMVCTCQPSDIFYRQSTFNFQLPISIHFLTQVNLSTYLYQKLYFIKDHNLSLSLTHTHTHAPHTPPSYLSTSLSITIKHLSLSSFSLSLNVFHTHTHTHTHTKVCTVKHLIKMNVSNPLSFLVHLPISSISPFAISSHQDSFRWFSFSISFSYFFNFLWTPNFFYFF